MNREYRLGNYSFASEEEYKKALKELKIILSIKQKCNIEDPETAKKILSNVSNSAISFDTAVGKSFLRHLDRVANSGLSKPIKQAMPLKEEKHKAAKAASNKVKIIRTSVLAAVLILYFVTTRGDFLPFQKANPDTEAPNSELPDTNGEKEPEDEKGTEQITGTLKPTDSATEGQNKPTNAVPSEAVSQSPDQKELSLEEAKDILIQKLNSPETNLIQHEDKKLADSNHYSFTYVDDAGKASEDLILVNKESGEVVGYDKSVGKVVDVGKIAPTQTPLPTKGGVNVPTTSVNTRQVFHPSVFGEQESTINKAYVLSVLGPSDSEETTSSYIHLIYKDAVFLNWKGKLTHTIEKKGKNKDRYYHYEAWISNTVLQDKNNKKQLSDEVNTILSYLEQNFGTLKKEETSDISYKVVDQSSPYGYSYHVHVYQNGAYLVEYCNHQD